LSHQFRWRIRSRAFHQDLHVVRHAFIRVAIDWTVENGIHTLVASAIIGRRAVPIYRRSYDEGSFKGHRSRIERAFVERLFKVILRDVPRAKLIVTADRGKASVLLFDLLDDLKIAFVIRAKENIKVFFQGAWRKLKLTGLMLDKGSPNYALAGLAF
jgi:hypothetical protein